MPVFKIVTKEINRPSCAYLEGGKRWTEVKNLAKVANYFKTKLKNNDKITSHNLLDRGVLCIPQEKMDTFYQCYALSLERGERNFIHEQRTHIFPFYIDIDLLLEREMTNDFLKKFLEKIYKVIFKWIKPAHRNDSVMVAAVPSYALKKDKIKFGIHLHFPFLAIDDTMAKNIMGYVLDWFQNNEMDTDIFASDWTKIFDADVYTYKNGNPRGLRMIGSRKCDPCSVCKEKMPQRKQCEHCEKTGRVDLGRAYWPKYVIGVSPIQSIVERVAELIDPSRNMLECVRLCSVRM